MGRTRGHVSGGIASKLRGTETKRQLERWVTLRPRDQQEAEREGPPGSQGARQHSPQGPLLSGTTKLPPSRSPYREPLLHKPKRKKKKKKNRKEKIEKRGPAAPFPHQWRDRAQPEGPARQGPHPRGERTLFLLEKRGCRILPGVVSDSPTLIPSRWAAPGWGRGRAFFRREGAAGGGQRP